MTDSQESASTTYSNFSQGIKVSVHCSSPSKCGTITKTTSWPCTSTPTDDSGSIPKYAEQFSQLAKVPSTPGKVGWLRKPDRTPSAKETGVRKSQSAQVAKSKKTDGKGSKKVDESPVWTSSIESASTEVQVGSIDSQLSRPTESQFKSSNNTAALGSKDGETVLHQTPQLRKSGVVAEQRTTSGNVSIPSPTGTVVRTTETNSSVDFVDRVIAILRRDNPQNVEKKSKPGPRCSKKLPFRQSYDGDKEKDSDDDSVSVIPGTPPLGKKRRVESQHGSSETEFELSRDIFSSSPVLSVRIRCQKTQPLAVSQNNIIVTDHENNENGNCEQHLKKGGASQHHSQVLEGVDRIDGDGRSDDENTPVQGDTHRGCVTGGNKVTNVKTNLLPSLRAAVVPLQYVTSAINSVAQMLSPAAVVAAAQGSERARLSAILAGVVAYVEVRSGHDNRSRGVCTQLRALGARVVEKMSKEVTHVIFNEGLPSTLKRARDQQCHLVSVLWIEECKNAERRVSESDFPPFGLDKYDSVTTMRRRKLKSLQPDFEEGKSDERINKLLHRIKVKELRHAPAHQQSEASSQNLDRAAVEGKAYHKNGVLSETASSIQRKKILNGDAAVKIPEGVVLKECNVVMDRLPTSSDGLIKEPMLSRNVFQENSLTQRSQKRKLMPIQREISNVSSLEDYDPRERLRPSCPYVEPKSTQSKRSQRHVDILGRKKDFVSVDKDADPKSLIGTQVSTQRSGTANKKHTRTTRQSRRSSFIFQGKKQRPPRRPSAVARKKEQKKKKLELRTMVCTYMHRRDIEVVAAVLKKLGGWRLEPTVTPLTTHVVCGDAKRTINLLRGIAYGCWILHQEWVMRSLESDKWLDEEPFEITAFPAVQQCRIARETLRARSEIFSAIGSIYVADNTSPPAHNIKELLKLFGGHVVSITRHARIIIGAAKRCVSENVPFVKEEWVLDSIQENMVLPVSNYQIQHC